MEADLAPAPAKRLVGGELLQRRVEEVPLERHLHPLDGVEVFTGEQLEGGLVEPHVVQPGHLQPTVTGERLEDLRVGAVDFPQRGRRGRSDELEVRLDPGAVDALLGRLLPHQPPQGAEHRVAGRVAGERGVLRRLAREGCRVEQAVPVLQLGEERLQRPQPVLLVLAPQRRRLLGLAPHRAHDELAVRVVRLEQRVGEDARRLGALGGLAHPAEQLLHARVHPAPSTSARTKNRRPRQPASPAAPRVKPASARPLTRSGRAMRNRPS